MSRKINKHLRRELANANAQLAMMIDKNAAAELEIAFYRKRFKKLGSMLDTIDEAISNRLAVVRLELEPIPFGHYAVVEKNMYTDDEFADIVKRQLIGKISEALMAKNLVQIIARDDIFNPSWTVSAKLFVVPWEQAPNAKTMEMRSLLNIRSLMEEEWE